MWLLIRVMMMGLIITTRTSDNGTLNRVCHHRTRAIACFDIPRTCGHGEVLALALEKGPAGQEMSQEDKQQPGSLLTWLHWDITWKIIGISPWD